MAQKQYAHMESPKPLFLQGIKSPSYQSCAPKTNQREGIWWTYSRKRVLPDFPICQDRLPSKDILMIDEHQ